MSRYITFSVAQSECLNLGHEQSEWLAQEYLQGVPASLCCRSGSKGRNSVSGSSSLFPEPRSDPSNGSPQDIAFSMLEGDFVVTTAFHDAAFLFANQYCWQIAVKSSP